MASFYISDTFGRKWALIIADVIFIIGSLVQTLIFGGNLPQLYVGRVIGGFGVGLISAVVPTVSFLFARRICDNTGADYVV
jgi:SP family sugar:H+ symporter-like MFS transporter